ncbi:MAG: sodium transporter ATP-binding protein [Acidobacteria bacterium]|nr:sodium transporter ATP-binding protein [Acidobacteriota bacterium]
MENACQCKNMVKTFEDFQLGPINLDLDPGVVLGLIGPNGSGKTTFIQCLVGLLRANAGEIKVFGRLNDLNKPQWKLNIGYVGDIHVFWERWTAAKNLEFIAQFYPNWSEQKATKLAERFRLPLGKRAKDLSTGNRVKLSLIMALAHSPRLLLLDEPTAGLDPVVRSELLDVLFETLETGDCAILYATHILPEISRLADDLAFIDDGQIWLRIPKEELCDRWRKISFRLAEEPIALKSIAGHRVEGNEHQVVSADLLSTLKQLKDLGAEEIQDFPMSVEEIAIQILKGRDHVEDN